MDHPDEQRRNLVKVTPRRQFWLLVGLLVIAAFLRLWLIGANSLWFDEAFTRDVAFYSNPLSIIRNETLGDLHPPLHFLLLHFWMQLSGDSEISLRALSAFASMLMLPACYHIGRLLFSRKTGVICVVLGAVSSLQIYYAQEVRGYMVSAMLSAFAVWGLIAMLNGRRYGPALYVLAAVGGLYTFYFVALPLAVVHLWVIGYKSFRQQWRKWMPADLLIAIVFLPQVVVVSQEVQVVLASFWIDKPNPAAPLTTLTFLLFGGTLPHGIDYVAVVLLICTLTLITIDMLRRVSRQVRFNWFLCAAMVLIPLIGVQLFSLLRGSIYLDRSFLPLTPLLLVILAAGVAYARRPSPVPILVGALVVLMVVGDMNHAFNADPTKPPFRQVAATLLAQPDVFGVPILYLHDSATLSMGYYAPALNQQSRVINLDEKSWLWPQAGLFPRTWDIFGFKRYSRDEIRQWLTDYHGKLRVVATVNLEVPEQETLSNLLKPPCSSTKIADGDFVWILDIQCPS
jgi:uncharacterized membrane protein